MQMYEDCFARVDFRCGVLKETLCKKALVHSINPSNNTKKIYKTTVFGLV